MVSPILSFVRGDAGKALAWLAAAQVMLSGCVGPLAPRARDPAQYAFITHTAATPGDTRLRLAVKDFIDLKGQITSGGSEYVLKNSAPARRDAACMRIARERGVNIVGKTNASEFGVTSSGINAYFGTPRSPLSRKKHLITGGSSSGSAVAVATGMADVAFGTDTGGSVRIPAAYCGVYGLKTTFGLVPLRGVFPMSPTHLDTVGPLAKDLDHLEIGMELLDEDFARKYRRAREQKPAAHSIRVGRLYVDGTDPAVDDAIDRALRKSGFRVVGLNDAIRRAFDQAQADGQTVAVVDGYRNDDKYRGHKGVSSITEASILLGQVESDLTYGSALARKADWQRVLRQVFQRVDLIALPTMKQLPPKIPRFGNSALFEARVFALQNTVAFNLSGTPAIAIPVPIEGQIVPLTSLQLAGPANSEGLLLNAARLMRSKGE